MSQTISIVIPLYNEEQLIAELHQRLAAVADTLPEQVEIVFVDDGSYDRTPAKLKALADADARISVLRLSRNFGHQAAISAGMQHATGDAVVLMDGDLQDPPEVLPTFLQQWREGYHVVYGVRQKRKEPLLMRLMYSTFYKMLRMVSSIEIPSSAGDFSVIDRTVVNVLVQEMPEQNRFLRGLRAYTGFRQLGLPYEREARAAGAPKYTPAKLFKLAFDGLFDFSTFPLRIAAYLGLFVSLVSFAAGVFFILHRLLDFKVMGYSPADVPGMATLAVGQFFLSGLLLLMLGIIGEYLGRIYIEVKKRPAFIVEEVYRAND